MQLSNVSMDSKRTRFDLNDAGIVEKFLMKYVSIYVEAYFFTIKIMLCDFRYRLLQRRQ